MIDTHCHLTFEAYKDDLDEVLSRAKAVEVDCFVIPSVDIASSNSGVELAAKHPECRVAIGIHPLYVDELEENWLEQLEQLISNEGVVAIGEIGLDYYHLPEDPAEVAKIKQKQKAVCISQIELANRYNKPIIFHSRNCFEDLIQLIAEYPLNAGFVIHCFTGTTDEAASWIAKGAHLSFTGIVTYKNAEALRQVLKTVPLEKIMLETDAPYLAPEGYRGKRSEPAHVAVIAQSVADIRGETLAVVAEATTSNSRNFFNIPG